MARNRWRVDQTPRDLQIQGSETTNQLLEYISSSRMREIAARLFQRLNVNYARIYVQGDFTMVRIGYLNGGGYFEIFGFSKRNYVDEPNLDRGIEIAISRAVHMGNGR